MNLIVTIPAYNEEDTIAEVISSVPKNIKNIKSIKILVVDDGSTDYTIKEVRKAGADYLFLNKNNIGLARTFNRAINEALKLGADIVVNTDADNQYDQSEINKLIVAIIEKKADLVNGDRQFSQLKHMPLMKKIGNSLGSYILRVITGLKINDASSGFRAYSRNCLINFNLLSDHTYTHETLIQAHYKKMKIEEIPITFKPRKHGGSKLITGIFSHVKKSSATIFAQFFYTDRLRF